MKLKVGSLKTNKINASNQTQNHQEKRESPGK